MLLSELAIIYLAAAAPFGVSRFFNSEGRGETCARRLARAALAALAWPATVLVTLLSGAVALGKRESDEEGRGPDEKRVGAATRALVNSLRSVEDALSAARGFGGEPDRQAMFAARESAERYAGLALACAGARADAEPSPRELELCRIAGRSGDDLLGAGRCIHRRNVTRLVTHRERARTDLVHALARVGELAREHFPAARPFRADEGDASEAASPTSEAEKVYEALMRAYSRAVELLSLFDERVAVVAVARLLDAESARLRRLGARESAAERRDVEGGESCTTQAVHTAFATRPLPTQTSNAG